MKLADLLLENRDLEKSLSIELEKVLGDYSPYVSIGSYAGGRPDSDPLKGKGYGTITFRSNGDVDDSDWQKALDWVESKGFEVTQESNWYEVDPGERTYYPTIKFNFSIEDS